METDGHHAIIVDTMNAFDKESVPIIAKLAATVDTSTGVHDTPMIEQVPDVPVPITMGTVSEPVGEAIVEQGTEESVPVAVVAEEIEDEEEGLEMPELMAQDPEDDDWDDEAEEEETRPQRSAQIASGVLKPSSYTMATKISKQ